MTLLERIRAAARSLFAGEWPDGSRPGPIDDFWYNPLGLQSASGQNVTPSSAMRSAAFFDAVRKLSGTVASLPLFLYRRTKEGKEPARDQPLFDILHSRPNDRQTSFQFRRVMQQWVEVYSNAYAKILSGPRGAVDQLIPLHPSRVTVKIANGRLLYEYRPRSGSVETYVQGEIFHLTGFSEEGIVGTPITEVGIEVIGMGLAAQDYAARYFANDATPGGALKHPKTLTPEGYKRLKEDWQKQHSGSGRHGVAIMEEGMEYQVFAADNRRAQVLELREHQVEETARLFGIPPHKIGDLRRSTFSNIEHQGLEYVVDSIIERVVSWEQAIGRDLILDPAQYFAEHVLAGLLRGDVKSRYEAYAVGRQWGWLSANEIRTLENMNTIGPAGDRYLEPMNMLPAGSSREDPASTGARAWDLARAAAARIFRKEQTVVAQGREKFSGDEFRAWAEAFYIGHARFVAEALRISPEPASNYAEQQFALLMGGNEEWKNATERLTSLAIARQ